LKESELKTKLDELENATEEQWNKAKDAFSQVREKSNELLSNIQRRLETTS
jgi:ElaB/YqjD/DUF883 family membrane-anchored ribosome-binding protein